MDALIITTDQEREQNHLNNGLPIELTSVFGMSLIERVILTAKKAADIKRYVIALGDSGKQIKGHLGDGSVLNVEIHYLENNSCHPLNKHSILNAKKLINRNFLLLKSAYIYDSRILTNLVNCELNTADILIAGDHNFNDRITKVAGDEGRNVATLCHKAGAFLCSPKILDHFEAALEQRKTGLKDVIAGAVEYGNVRVLDASGINPYISAMRKEIVPFCLEIKTTEDIKKAEKILIQNVCKGRNDLLATYVNKPIENFIVKQIANLKVTPNQISFFINLIAYAATFLFFKGFLIIASILTFVVSFMDGVDGKLSRIKLSSSHLGKMEHAFDFLFEHSWYIALAVYLSSSHGRLPLILCILILLFDGFKSYCGKAFGKAYKNCGLEDYGKPERIFRKFDGRKNSYIIFILAGALLNAPLYSLTAVTFWSFVSAAFYSIRTLKHLYALDREKLYV